ncbi:MurR/RpiR family transcriptional regulator [Virgibacillus sp. C22-A2]|uniref:MurR/RpiR family transcriptional regulator n=1 Tax=Virgibacillus tibetensis TaxID=3042313 RepID=A0ABU6KFS5_9BACI|nr:MurR/RpiR family transcriptional regulator [Virgibacillus sp. C22-A2]
MEQIYKKISEQQSSFSKGFKKIAEYFYRDPQVFAMNSATQAGRKIGVSETTIIRFAYQLGYSGYSTLQRDVLEQLFKKSSLTNYTDEKSNNIKEPIKGLMQYDIKNIQRVYSHISEDDLNSVVSKLRDADSVLVSGVRASYAFANWFAYALDIVRGNARLFHPNIDDILLRVSEMTEKNVLVSFSFHRYAKETINIAKLVKQSGASIIAITDSPSAPISHFADIVIPVQTYSKSTLDVTPVVFSLLNSIVSTISIRDSHSFQKRTEKFDSIDAEDFFFKGYFE